MDIELLPRTRENVLIYFDKVRDREIKKSLPIKAKSVSEAVADFERALLPSSTSYGKCIYVDSRYVGDVWAYCIGEDTPNAMLSFCIFEKSLWYKGIATKAAALFIAEIKDKFGLKSLGAFTYSDNSASIAVLCGNGFAEAETFTENGVESKYFRLDMVPKKS